VPARGFEGDPAPGPRRYAGFRLYARELEDVAVLRDLLAARGIETHTRAAQVRFVLELDTSLGMVLLLVAAASGAGFVAAAAGTMRATVHRKRRHLGLLRLVGLSGSAVMAYPLTQALLTGAGGTLLAGAAYLAVGPGIDRLFAERLYGAAICNLPSAYAVAVGLGVPALCAAAAFPAAVRASRIEPSEALREL